MNRLANLLSLFTRPRPVVGATPSDVVHAENKWRLLRYRPRAAGLAWRTPVLLVPSLINRHYVLDLMPGKSFAEFLVGRGHDVFCIDWGTPGDEDRYLELDEICDRYLGRALRIATRGSPEGRAHLLGYCLGGTLAVIHAAARPERVASLCAIAAPVQFGGAGLLEAWTRSPGFDVAALVEGFGNVPWQLMQSAFLMLRPTLQLAKLVSVADRAGRAWDDAYADGFLALETWGNDNVSFPGAAYRRYVEELYRRNALMKGELRLGGVSARLESIGCPTLAVTFEHDNIVPAASASVLLDRIAAKDRERIHLPGGHVGAMVSRAAAESLWPKISAFWAARDGAVREPGKRAARRPRPRPRSRSTP